MTAVGDVVNTASRIESANRVLDTSFIISEDAYLAVSDHVAARPLPPVELPGKTGQFALHQVLHSTKAESSDNRNDFQSATANPLREPPQ